MVPARYRTVDIFIGLPKQRGQIKCNRPRFFASIFRTVVVIPLAAAELSLPCSVEVKVERRRGEKGRTLKCPPDLAAAAPQSIKPRHSSETFLALVANPPSLCEGRGNENDTILEKTKTMPFLHEHLYGIKELENSLGERNSALALAALYSTVHTFQLVLFPSEKEGERMGWAGYYAFTTGPACVSGLSKPWYLFWRWLQKY